MAIDLNNSQVNSFTGGMNTDLSYDQISNQQYTYGHNIRITNNTLLFGQNSSNKKEGVVCPVLYGEDITITLFDRKSTSEEWNIESIMATDTILDIGAIVVKYHNNHWGIIKVINIDDHTVKLKEIFRSKKTTEKERFSIVINKEQENILKLYIATGLDSVISMNILDEEYLVNIDDEELLLSNIVFPIDKVKILKQISGTLKTSLIQYTYRLYHKYGVCSKLAPLTNKIQVVDEGKSNEIGNAQNTQTNIGFQLGITISDYLNARFDRILIYRISYIIPNLPPIIDLIFDGKPERNDDYMFVISDTGLKSLLNLSVEEFSALDGYIIIPEIIEQNQNYLFASNIKDRSKYKLDANINCKSYSFNDKGKAYLYSDQTYVDGVIWTENDINIDMDIDLVNKYLTNKWSDVNIGNKNLYKINEPGDHSEFCFLDNYGYYGGYGPIVSWRLIGTKIPIKENINDNLEPKKIKNRQNSNLFLVKLNSSGELEFEDMFLTIDGYFEEHGIKECLLISYDDIFTSSLFRSLKRGETYRYGIIFYGKDGSKSDVQWIADIKIPEANSLKTTYIDHLGNLYAIPLGVEFSVNWFSRDIIGYQIVRCDKSDNYSRIMNTGVLSRTFRQKFEEKDGDLKTSPYYPGAFITTQPMKIFSGDVYVDNICRYDYLTKLENRFWYNNDGSVTLTNSNDKDPKDCNFWSVASSYGNNSIFQFYSPEILYSRNDLLSRLKSYETTLDLVEYQYGENLNDLDERLSVLDKWGYRKEFAFAILPISKAAQSSSTSEGIEVEKYITLIKSFLKFDYDEKTQQNFVIWNTYSKDMCTIVDKVGNINAQSRNISEIQELELKDISDVLNPNWEDGFSNIQIVNGYKIGSGIKKYKSYVNNIYSKSYVNWIAQGMYDMSLGEEDTNRDPVLPDGYRGMSSRVFTYGDKDSTTGKRSPMSTGWIGPGPVCFTLALNESDADNIDTLTSIVNSYYAYTALNVTLGTFVCNICHKAQQYAGVLNEDKQYDVYYGFGNFQLFKNVSMPTSICVFDGDTYITPCEFTSLYKAYDFNSADSLYSSQVVYYIPLESKINTFFDYGMNYKNTSNKNLQLEPGMISGVSNQNRPQYQYNMIYSENNTSIDVYNALSIDENEIIFPQRTIFSQLKINGENIDNWNIFLPFDYIDCDSRYGSVVNLLTNKDVLYFWLNKAFGKFSVNERSLINDQNNNVILLGQGGVLQRTDYINTKYGMRDEDFCAISAENGIYWLDVENKALVVSDNQSVINYGEIKNVLNKINNIFSLDSKITPVLFYDMQNNELCCMINRNTDVDFGLMIFNLKLNIPTSTYNRKYESVISFNNKIFGINTNNLSFTKFNYLQNDHLSNYNDNVFLKPTVLEFVVNQAASNTKVFDNQQLVTLKRTFDADYIYNFLKTKNISFVTDINSAEIENDYALNIPNSAVKQFITDREGNIRYAIPRTNNDALFGERLRGKWMVERITENEPNEEFSISHIITKFRQSYS